MNIYCLLFWGTYRVIGSVFFVEMDEFCFGFYADSVSWGNCCDWSVDFILFILNNISSKMLCGFIHNGFSGWSWKILETISIMIVWRVDIFYIMYIIYFNITHFLTRNFLLMSSSSTTNYQLDLIWKLR